MHKMASMSQKRLCWNNAVTMATPQIFFSQPSILYPRHITESKKYGFALFYRGEGFTFFHPPGRCTIGEGGTNAQKSVCKFSFGNPAQVQIIDVGLYFM